MRPGAALLTAALLASGCTSAPADDPAPSPPVVQIVPPPMIDDEPPRVIVDRTPPPEWIAATRVPGFRKCMACHNVERGAPNGTGPNLYDVFGRPAASQPDYLYSPQLRRSALVWDYATLDRWLANPRALVPGTKMVFAGLRNPEDRKAIIAFLRLRSEARP